MPVIAAYIAVIMIWSTTPLAIKWSGEDAGYLFGVTSRMLIGVLICLIILGFMKIRLALNRTAIATYLSASMGIYGAMLCTYWGAQHITSGMVSVLFGLSPLLTGIFAALILQERSLTPAKLAGVALGLIGLVIIFRSDISSSDFSSLGISAVILATVLHSLSTVLIKRLDCKLPGIVVNTGSLLISCLLFLLTWVLTESSLPGSLSIRSGIAILYLGILGTVVGFTLYFYTLKRVDASKVGLIPLVTPVLALLLGYTLNNEPVSYNLMIGASLILLGLLAHNWQIFFRRYRRA